MGERNGARLAVATLAVIVAVIASGCARDPTSPSPNDGASAAPSQASIAPSPANPDPPLPVPDGSRILAVLDPEVVRPKVNADQAIELARATFKTGVGESPSVQLATVAFHDGGSVFTPVWTGWIIVSTDLLGFSSCGPYACVPEPTVVPYTWVWVTVDGEVLLMSEDTPGSVPAPD